MSAKNPMVDAVLERPPYEAMRRWAARSSSVPMKVPGPLGRAVEGHEKLGGGTLDSVRSSGTRESDWSTDATPGGRPGGR